MILENTVDTLKKMKEAHEAYEISRTLQGGDKTISLLAMVNTEIQRPNKGVGYGILLPTEKDDNAFIVSFKSIGSNNV